MHEAKDSAMNLEDLYTQVNCQTLFFLIIKDYVWKIYDLKRKFQSTTGRRISIEELNQLEKQKMSKAATSLKTEIEKITKGSSAKWIQELKTFTEVLA